MKPQVCPRCGNRDPETVTCDGNTHRCLACGFDGNRDWRERAEAAEAENERLRRECDRLLSDAALVALQAALAWAGDSVGRALYYLKNMQEPVDVNIAIEELEAGRSKWEAVAPPRVLHNPAPKRERGVGPESMTQ